MAPSFKKFIKHAQKPPIPKNSEYSDKIMELASWLDNAITSGQIVSKKQLERLKLTLCHDLNLKEIPTNPDILARLPNSSPLTRQLLGIKFIRTLSGVAPVAIMTVPKNCPHGTCLYCPGGEDSFFGSIPKSYTGHEPASMRAILNHYDAYLQVSNRLAQYFTIGHIPEKVELIIMGGTFPSYPVDYQNSFVTSAIKAMNDFDAFYENNKLNRVKLSEFFEFPFNESNEQVRARVHARLLDRKGQPDLLREQLRNETAPIRCVTFCVETKPDWCKQPHLHQMLSLGCTRVELGVQSLREDVLKFTNRGHTLQDTQEAIQLAKDCFLKTVFHIMPGQPLTDRESDLEMFRELFSNSLYRPDGLKIYPCMVMPGTGLAKLYSDGNFIPLTTEQAAEIIAEGKQFIEPYCRVHRVQRDIPVQLAISHSKGINKNNLRQLVELQLKKKKISCKCIRCREVGIASYKQNFLALAENAQLRVQKYNASNGIEYFISLEEPKLDLLFGFLRLRLPYAPFRSEISEHSAGVRELHVFGESLSLQSTKALASNQSLQHKGLGSTLLAHAEKIAREELDARELLVIAGMGVREYYFVRGYSRKGVYVAKPLN